MLINSHIASSHRNNSSHEPIWRRRYQREFPLLNLCWPFLQHGEVFRDFPVEDSIVNLDFSLMTKQLLLQNRECCLNKLKVQSDLVTGRLSQ